MQVIVNGAPRETAAASVAELLRECAADPARVAVVVNGRVVPRDARLAAPLAPGDSIELLAFAGGG